MSLRLGELCAGYNGLGMAIEEVFGATPAWFSEFDAAPSKILAHHYPDVPNYGDMTKIDWAGIEPVDIISGGTPCQDLSAAGRRRGMTEGTRSNLWVQMREAVAIQKPKYVVWENVRGAYSATAASDLEQCPGCMGDTGDGRVFLRALGRVLGDLSDLGYDCQWRGLRAADVGACHGRFRVFILAAHPGRVGRREGNVPARLGTTGLDRATVPYESDPRRLRPEYQDATHADSVGHERPRDARGRWTRLADGGQPLADTEGIGRGEGWTESTGILRRLSTTGDSASVADAASARRAEGEDGGTGCCHACKRPWGIEPERASGERVGASQDAMRIGSGGRASESEPTRSDNEALGSDPGRTNWGDYEPAIRRWERTIGRTAPRPTEPTGRNGGHRLSPRFTEFMMGLPDGWVTDPAIGISRNEQLKACGNGVVPQQAMAALRDMLRAFESQTQDVAA